MKGNTWQECWFHLNCMVVSYMEYLLSNDIQADWDLTLTIPLTIHPLAIKILSTEVKLGEQYLTLGL